VEQRPAEFEQQQSQPSVVLASALRRRRLVRPSRRQVRRQQRARLSPRHEDRREPAARVGISAADSGRRRRRRRRPLAQSVQPHARLAEPALDERSADAVKGGVKGARWLRERDGGRSLAHHELHAPRRSARAASGGTLTASIAGQVKRQHRERECAVVRDRLLEKLQHPRDGLVLS